MNWWVRSTKRFLQNYNEHFFILFSAIIGCISIFAFVCLLGIPIRIMSSDIVLEISTITAEA